MIGRSLADAIGVLLTHYWHVKSIYENEGNIRCAFAKFTAKVVEQKFVVFSAMSATDEERKYMYIYFFRRIIL